jgi:hypothetical protein
MSAMHLIRFANKKEHKRGLTALLDIVGVDSLGLPDFQMVVTDEHILALERARVAFAYLSKPAPNGKNATPLQS